MFGKIASEFLVGTGTTVLGLGTGAYLATGGGRGGYLVLGGSIIAVGGLLADEIVDRIVYRSKLPKEEAAKEIKETPADL